MTSRAAGYARIKECFLGAVDLPAEQRAAYLEETCGADAPLRAEVEHLLRLHDQSSFQRAFPPVPLPPASSALGALQAAVERRASRGVPQRIGEYEIVGALGAGGMGVVYEAKQQNPLRHVALKAIRPDLATASMLRRFEHEACWLARLQHPGIAQIYEAGTADVDGRPQPYFAMELVRGPTLTAYADARRLTTAQRLALIQKVCAAVEHAHQKGVIHRDLKPGNILVDEAGQPKILDFGVARATDSDIQTTTLRTDIGQLIGTVPYMSPEQVLGNPDELDTRSDVYALGVVSYELLTGRLPHELAGKTIPEALRIIGSDVPTPLSSISRVFRGDLSTIVDKALAKDRERRYQTASELAADFQRHLRNEPILARAPSATYHFRKLVVRHKAPSALVAVLLALMCGTSMWMSVLYSRAETNLGRALQAEEDTAAEAERARIEAETATRVKDFLVEIFKAPDPDRSLGDTITAREMLDRGAERISVELQDEPVVQATLMDTMSTVYESLGIYDRAVELAAAALTIRRRELGDAHQDTAASLRNLGVALVGTGDYAGAQKPLREALAIRRALFGNEHECVAGTLGPLGLLALRAGDYETAETLLTQSLDLHRKLFSDDNSRVLVALTNMAAVYMKQGRFADALPLQREVLEFRQRNLDPKHPDLALAMNNLAASLSRTGDRAEAERMFREALALRRDVLPEDHPGISTALNNLARVLAAQGDYEAAEPLYRESLEMRRRQLGGEHPRVATALNNLGLCLYQQGDYGAARSTLQQAVAMRRKLLGENHRDLANSVNNLALTYWAEEDYASAKHGFREALAIYQRALRHAHPWTAACLRKLARALHKQGRYEEAERFYRESLAMFRGLRGEDHPQVARVLYHLAELFHERGDVGQAELFGQQALEIRRRAWPAGDPKVADALLLLSRILLDGDRTDEAEPLLRECVALRLDLLPEGDGKTVDARNTLGACLLASGHYQEAETLLVAAYKQRRDARGADHQDTQQTLRLLCDLYEAWGRPDQAAHYRTATHIRTARR